MRYHCHALFLIMGHGLPVVELMCMPSDLSCMASVYRFLLAARKRKKQTTSNYIISLDYEDLGRDSEKFFGKLRSNFVGTDFTVFDDGEKPSKKGGEGQTRKELACLTYQYNVLGTRGPRKMTACIPAVDGSGRSMYRPNSPDDSLLER